MGYRERGVARQGAQVRFRPRPYGVSEGRAGDRFDQLGRGHERQQRGERYDTIKSRDIGPPAIHPNPTQLRSAFSKQTPDVRDICMNIIS